MEDKVGHLTLSLSLGLIVDLRAGEMGSEGEKEGGQGEGEREHMCVLLTCPGNFGKHFLPEESLFNFCRSPDSL